MKDLMHWKVLPFLTTVAAIAVILLEACLFCPAPAEASIADILGVGSRGTAMGMAYTAVAEDYSAVYFNPAGLTQVKRANLTFQVTFAKARFTLANRDQLLNFYQNSPSYKASADPAATMVATMVTKSISTGDMPDANGAMIGFSGDLGYLTGAKNLFFGLAMYIPFGKLVETPVVFRTDDLPYFVRYVDNLQGMDMHVGLGYRLLDKLSIGAGLHVFLNLEGETFIDTTLLNLKNIQDVKNISVLPGVNRQAIMAYAPLGSILLRPIDRLRIGVTYRGENKAKIKYNQYITIGLREPNPEEPAVENSLILLAASLPFDYVFYFTPQSVTTGVAYQLTDRVLVSCDLAWYQYSHFIDGKGNDPKPSFNDIWVPRVGVDYKLTELLHLYCGYFYEPSPVPDQTTLNDYLDANRHVLSVGFGLTLDKPLPIWHKPLTIQGFFQDQILENRPIRKIDNALYGPDYYIKGYILQAGLSLVFHY